MKYILLILSIIACACDAEELNCPIERVLAAKSPNRDYFFVEALGQNRPDVSLAIYGNGYVKDNADPFVVPNGQDQTFRIYVPFDDTNERRRFWIRKVEIKTVNAEKVTFVGAIRIQEIFDEEGKTKDIKNRRGDDWKKTVLKFDTRQVVKRLEITVKLAAGASNLIIRGLRVFACSGV